MVTLVMSSSRRVRSVSRAGGRDYGRHRNTDQTVRYHVGGVETGSTDEFSNEPDRFVLICKNTDRLFLSLENNFLVFPRVLLFNLR